MEYLTINDILTIVSLLMALIGGLFAGYQWSKSVRLSRANYINELTEKIRSDDDIKDTVYLIDYGKEWYSRDFHSSKNKTEIKIDKTLSYFSYICYLKKKRIITKAEFKFFEYEINRICINRNVKNYFYNLYHFSKANNCDFTFVYLFKYAKRKKFIDEEFYDKNAHVYNRDYDKYLNW